MLAPTPSLRRWLGLTVVTAMLAALIPATAGVAMAAAATHLTVTASNASPLSGQSFSVTVTALDGTNAVDTGYTGTVHFTSSDADATKPLDYTFVGGDNGTHTFTNGVTLLTAGSQTVTATDTVTSSITGAANVSVKFQLVFTQSPNGGASGAVWTTQAIVQLQDNGGTPLTNAHGGNATITLAIGTNPGGGTLSGCGGLTASNGTATIAGCKIDKAGVGYTLVASATNAAANATSSSFTITAGAADHLIFSTQPARGMPDVAFQVQPVVDIVDAAGNRTADTNAVTLTLKTGGGSLAGCTTAVNAVAGRATFASCRISAVGVGDVLTATTTGLATNTVDSAAFDVADRIVFSTSPAGATAGTAFTTQPVVQVRAGASNVATHWDSGSVTLTIKSGTGASGASLTCNTNPLGFSAGVASFSACRIDKISPTSTPYVLTATSSGFASVDSSSFAVTAGPPTKLVFTAQPTAATAGQAFPIQPVVSITDAGGNVNTTTSATITLAIGTNPSSGTLTCTGGNSKVTSSGVATFAGCLINNAGSGYTLTATASGVSPTATLTSATSTAFTVTAPTAQITLTTTASVITWGSGITLTTHFAVNAASKQFTLQRSSPDHVSWATIATLTTDSSGNASFFYRPATNNWYRAVFSGTGDLLAANSNEVRVVVRQISILRPTNGGKTVYVTLGTSRTFTTTVRPARPELPAAKVSFVFYHKVSGHWVLVATRNVFIDDAGLAKYTFRFGSDGEWYVRSIANPTFANANSVWSAVEHFLIG